MLEELCNVANKGKFTILSRCRGEIVYAFPGVITSDSYLTLGDTKVVIWHPSRKNLLVVSVQTLELIKKVDTHLDKSSQAESFLASVLGDAQLLQTFIATLDEEESFLASGIRAFISMMNNQKDITGMETYFTDMLDQIKEHYPEEREIFEILYNLYWTYLNFCEQKKQRQRIQEIREYAKKQNMSDDEFEKSEEIVTNILETHGEEHLQQMRRYACAEVVLTGMFLGDREFYTREEIVDSLHANRPMFQVLPPPILKENVSTGLEVARDGMQLVDKFIPGGMVEHNELMDVFRLTPAGFAVALAILEKEKNS